MVRWISVPAFLIFSSQVTHSSRIQRNTTSIYTLQSSVAPFLFKILWLASPHLLKSYVLSVIYSTFLISSFPLFLFTLLTHLQFRSCTTTYIHTHILADICPVHSTYSHKAFIIITYCRSSSNYRLLFHFSFQFHFSSRFGRLLSLSLLFLIVRCRCVVLLLLLPLLLLSLLLLLYECCSIQVCMHAFSRVHIRFWFRSVDRSRFASAWKQICSRVTLGLD